MFHFSLLDIDEKAKKGVQKVGKREGFIFDSWESAKAEFWGITWPFYEIIKKKLCKRLSPKWTNLVIWGFELQISNKLGSNKNIITNGKVHFLNKQK